MQPDFTGILRSKGFRATPGRVELLALLYRADKPLTVEQASKRLRLNTVTLYRALEELADAGLLLRGSDGRTAHFAYASKNHHHHMICTDCGFAQLCRAC